MGFGSRALDVGVGMYDESYRLFHRSRDRDQVRYEVLKRCSLMTCVSQSAFDAAASDLDYSFGQLRRVLVAYPAETGWFQINGVTRMGAWAAWWRDSEGVDPRTGRPAGMAETALRLAGHLATVDGDTAMVERLRLLVVAGDRDQAIRHFDSWYAAFEAVADFTVCRRLTEAVAPDELGEFAADETWRDLLDRRRRAERRLAMGAGLREYFEQTRDYLSRPELEGILESAVVGTGPPRVGLIHEDNEDMPPGPPKVIHMHAPGGMGKSTQLAWLVARHGAQQDPPVLSAVCDVQTLVIDRLLARPALLLVKVAERFVEQEQALGYNRRAGLLKEFSRKYAKYRRDLDPKFGSSDGTPFQWHTEPPPQSLVTDFIDALNGLAQAPLLLCLDTTDELLQAGSSELAGLLQLLGELVRKISWLRVVLSGRADVTERTVFQDAFSKVPWRALELGPFTARQANCYLRDLRGIDAGQAERIVRVCEQDIEGAPGFTPLILALLADTPSELPSATGKSLYLFVVDRELANIEDERTSLALTYCSVARHPTREYFDKVLVPLLDTGRRGSDGSSAGEDPMELWDSLIKYAKRSAWIKAEDKRLLVHVNVRRELRRRMRSDEESAWKRLHRDGAQRCADLAEQARKRENHDEAAGWVAEQVYHQLHDAAERQRGHQDKLWSAAQTWYREVARAWRRGAFATVIDLADRLLSADLETAESEREGLGEPDPRVMPPQLWYDIALERAYGELYAVLYDDRHSWWDVNRYLKLARKRAGMSVTGEPPVRPDERRAELIAAALELHEGVRTGAGPVLAADEKLRRVLDSYGSDPEPRDSLQDLWVSDARLLLASCRVRIGRTQDDGSHSHAQAERMFTGMFDMAVERRAPQAMLVARYAVRDWQLADRPDLVRNWLQRYETQSEQHTGRTPDWVLLAGAEADLRSGTPVSRELPGGSALDGVALRADILRARSHLLAGAPDAAESLLRELTLPAVSGQVEHELAFDTLMVLAQANAAMLELEEAETNAGRAMNRASDDEERLSVMALRATSALADAGDLALAGRWIARARPLREDPRGAAGTVVNRAECVLLHRWGRTDDVVELLAAWAAQLRDRRDGVDGQSPPTPAEWLAYGLHALVCGRSQEAKVHLATITVALESIPDTGRRLMLLADEVRLYGPVADEPLLTDRPRIDAAQRLLARRRTGRGGDPQAAGLAALWAAQLHARLLGADAAPRVAAEMRAAVELLGRGNGRVHATWLQLHRLLPADLVPAPLPPADPQDPQRPVLRAADLLARAHHTGRWRTNKTAVQAAALLGPATATPTEWHLRAARHGADVGLSADALAERLHSPQLEESRRQNLQFALQRLGRYEGETLPAGKPDDAWRKVWAALQREAPGGVPAHLRQAVLEVATERAVTQVEIDVQGDTAVGSAPRAVVPPRGSAPSAPSGAPVVWPVTENFLFSGGSDGLDPDRTVDVILLHGEMRPLDRGAALRLPGSARSIRPEDVDGAVRRLCEQRRQPPPLLVLDALPQDMVDGSESQLRDLFAYQLHLLGYVPAVLASGPVVSDPEGTWRETAFSHAIGFGRTAEQVAERLRQFALPGHGSGRPAAARIRLLSHIPEEEMFGIGLL
ncbi:hypothetical protein OG266_10555 [Streptomyces sp. NBC_00554]|uniref:hypothetical protein n=1 Tax=Streptomyces sp. NBC_00554 TaxID=2903661 RepID=UPI00352C567D|nr:hypothetical protein OG266_10555 [Streptomyces sp. NBC_00554]